MPSLFASCISRDPATIVRCEVERDIWLDGDLGLYLAAHGTLVIADLHWGYAIAHRARGNLLPFWGNEEIEARLTRLIARYRPRRMVWLGDSLHQVTGRAPAEAFLAGLDPGLEVTILRGNHDRGWEMAGETSLRLGEEFFLHHGDAEVAPGNLPEGCREMVGHWHPAVYFNDGAGFEMKLPALVAGPRRMILPAFSPWARSVSWCGRQSAEEVLWSISPRRILGPVRKG